jgi:hypothetical protein
MDRRRCLGGFGTVVAAGALSGCAGDGDGGGDGHGNGNWDGNGSRNDGGGTGGDEADAYGFLSTSVTDQPNDIGDFESLVVTLEGIWVKPAGTDEGDETPDAEDDGDGTPDAEDDGTPEDETEMPADGTDSDEDDEDGEDEDDEGAGREYIEFEEPQEADLVELQNGETQLVDETELAVGEYEFLQLDVSGTTGVLAESGEEATVETPGNAPLKFQQAFEIRSGETTHFVADFAPFRRGNGAYLIRPVASGTEVRYGDDPDGTAESDDGEGGDATEDGDVDDESTDENESTDDDAATGNETGGDGPNGAGN